MKKLNLFFILQIILVAYIFWLLWYLIPPFLKGLSLISSYHIIGSIFDISFQSFIFTPLLLITLIFQLSYFWTKNYIFARNSSVMFVYAYGLLIIYTFSRFILEPSANNLFLTEASSIVVLILIFGLSLILYQISKKTIGAPIISKLTIFLMSFTRTVFLLIAIFTVLSIALYFLLGVGLPKDIIASKP